MQCNQLVGNHKLMASLQTIVKAGRVHHTQLFLAKEGSGSLAFVRAYAQYLLCENPKEEDSCGKCRQCTKVAKLIHPDVHVTFPTIAKKTGEKPISDDYIAEFRSFVDQQPFGELTDWLNYIQAENKQGNISARECEEITKKAKFRRLEGNYKINIIWCAEALAKEGNRLLKILEEPPNGTLFLLIAQDENKLLNTIISRCQVNRMARIQEHEMEAYLQAQSVLPEQAKSISVLADGNMNLALQYVDHGYSKSHILQWFRVILSQQSQIVSTVEELAKLSKENIKKMLLQGTYFFREALLLQQNSSASQLPESDQALANYLSQQVDVEGIKQLTNLLESAIYSIERNANIKLLLLSLSIEIQHILKQGVSIR